MIRNRDSAARFVIVESVWQLTMKGWFGTQLKADQPDGCQAQFQNMHKQCQKVYRKNLLLVL